MAERRMFAKTIILSDAFLDMPTSARCLYFTLGMLADDDGFVNSPKAIMRQCGASVDDMNVLVAKKFVLPFESGVVVIKHWRVHNYIQKDRYNPTKYMEEKSALSLDDKGIYHMDTVCIHDVYKPYTQDRLEIDKESISNIIPQAEPTAKEEKHKHGEFRHVLLTDTQLKNLVDKFGDVKTMKMIQILDEAIEMKGYKYKNHYLVITKADSWVQREAMAKNAPVNTKAASKNGIVRGTDFDSIVQNAAVKHTEKAEKAVELDAWLKSMC